MTDTTKDLLKRALELSPEEREQLAREILASLEDAGSADEEFVPSIVTDLRGRVDRALAGTSDPGDDYHVVLERLRRRHDERKRKQAEIGEIV